MQPLLLLQGQALQLSRLRVHGLQLVSCRHWGREGGWQVPVRSSCGQEGQETQDRGNAEHLLWTGRQLATEATETKTLTGKSQSCKLPAIERIQTSAWHSNPHLSWAGPQPSFYSQLLWVPLHPLPNPKEAHPTTQSPPSCPYLIRSSPSPPSSLPKSW